MVELVRLTTKQIVRSMISEGSLNRYQSLCDRQLWWRDLVTVLQSTRSATRRTTTTSSIEGNPRKRGYPELFLNNTERIVQSLCTAWCTTDASRPDRLPQFYLVLVLVVARMKTRAIVDTPGTSRR